MTARLSVLVVTRNERALVERCLPALVTQLSDDDELIVADNDSSDGTADAVERLAPSATVLRMRGNRGYMVASNAAARRATGDLLLTLDPDTIVAPGFCEAIRTPLRDGRGWAAWMGLLTMDGGHVVNTSGGVTHFTGISWAGQIGLPVEQAAREPREVGFLTGACLAVAREWWRPFPEHYFLYFDDVDFSLATRLAGGRIGIEPSARADHLYEFERRRMKWRLLERNRWATIVRTYPAELLWLVAPALVATEVALLFAAARGGWLRDKLLAIVDATRWVPRLMRERREIQASRTVSAAEFATGLTAELSSPYLGWVARSRTVRSLSAYWLAVCAALRRIDGHPSGNRREDRGRGALA